MRGSLFVRCTVVLSLIQLYVLPQLQCCGVSLGPKDWTKATDGSYVAVWWIESGNHSNDVPDSCCVKNTTGCGIGMVMSSNDTTIWQKVLIYVILLTVEIPSLFTRKI